MKKIVILIGNYGSGKTEIALNMAVMAASEGKCTQVIDLDKINDYFRMSDHVKLLEDKKINIVSPTFAGQGVTQSSMSAAVASAFAQDWDLVVWLSLTWAVTAPERCPWPDITRTLRPYRRVRWKSTTL